MKNPFFRFLAFRIQLRALLYTTVLVGSDKMAYLCTRDVSRNRVLRNISEDIEHGIVNSSMKTLFRITVTNGANRICIRSCTMRFQLFRTSTLAVSCRKWDIEYRMVNSSIKTLFRMRKMIVSETKSEFANVLFPESKIFVMICEILRRTRLNSRSHYEYISKASYY